MSDTGPAEIAALINDEPRYRTFVVLKLQEHGNRLTNIEAKVAGVSSSVNDYESVKQKADGAKRLFLGTIALVAALGGCILFVIEALRFVGRGAS